MCQSGRAGDEAKKRKSPAKSGRVGIYVYGSPLPPPPPPPPQRDVGSYATVLLEFLGSLDILAFIDLFHNGGLLMYSFTYMIIKLSDLV